MALLCYALHTLPALAEVGKCWMLGQNMNTTRVNTAEVGHIGAGHYGAEARQAGRGKYLKSSIFFKPCAIE